MAREIAATKLRFAGANIAPPGVTLVVFQCELGRISYLEMPDRCTKDRVHLKVQFLDESTAE